MNVNKLECYRYYSDLAGFDLVVIVEEGNADNLEVIIDGLVGKWFEPEEDAYFIPLTEFIIDELKKLGLVVSIYSCISE